MSQKPAPQLRGAITAAAKSTSPVAWPEEIVRIEMEKSGWQFKTDPLSRPLIELYSAGRHVITPEGVRIDQTPASNPLKLRYYAAVSATRKALGIDPWGDKNDFDNYAP